MGQGRESIPSGAVLAFATPDQKWRLDGAALVPFAAPSPSDLILVTFLG